MKKDIEKIKNLKNGFAKCVNILEEILELEESKQDVDKNKKEERQDELLDMFVLQMIKISKTM